MAGLVEIYSADDVVKRSKFHYFQIFIRETPYKYFFWNGSGFSSFDDKERPIAIIERTNLVKDYAEAKMLGKERNYVGELIISAIGGFEKLE